MKKYIVALSEEERNTLVEHVILLYAWTNPQNR